MRGGARFGPDEARLEFGKAYLDFRTSKFATEHFLAFSIDAIGMKHFFRDIQADCNWLQHLTSSICWPQTPSGSGQVMDAAHGITSGRDETCESRTGQFDQISFRRKNIRSWE